MKEDRESEKRPRAPRGTTTDADAPSKEDQIAELQAIVKAYEEKFNQIKEPPLLSAYVLRLQVSYLDPHEVVLSHGPPVITVPAGQVKQAAPPTRTSGSVPPDTPASTPPPPPTAAARPAGPARRLEMPGR